MKISDKGLLEIAEHEGIVPAPYKDSVGVWTFGVGHTKAAGAPYPEDMVRGMTTTLDNGINHALDVFRDDMVKYEDRVNKAITVQLLQYEFDALVSFDFNTGGIGRARLTRAINAGDQNAARHFMGWLKPPEIRKRRMAEMRLFETGDYDANGDSIPVYRVDAGGRLRGIAKTVSGVDLLNLMRRIPSTSSDAPKPKKVPLYLSGKPKPKTVSWWAKLFSFFER